MREYCEEMWVCGFPRPQKSCEITTRRRKSQTYFLTTSSICNIGSDGFSKSNVHHEILNVSFLPFSRVDFSEFFDYKISCLHTRRAGLNNWVRTEKFSLGFSVNWSSSLETTEAQLRRTGLKARPHQKMLKKFWNSKI